MAKLKARLLATALGFKSIPDICLKYKMGDISKGKPTHSSPPKKKYIIYIRSRKKMIEKIRRE